MDADLAFSWWIQRFAHYFSSFLSRVLPLATSAHVRVPVGVTRNVNVRFQDPVSAADLRSDAHECEEGSGCNAAARSPSARLTVNTYQSGVPQF